MGTPEDHLSALSTQLKIHLKNRDFKAGRQALVQFAATGGTSNEAMDLLYKLRERPDLIEDDVLDLMDVASGWCSPTWRIWDA